MRSRRSARICALAGDRVTSRVIFSAVALERSRAQRVPAETDAEWLADERYFAHLAGEN